MALLLLASLIGYWVFLGSRYPAAFAALPFVIVCSLLSLLYVAGVVGALELGRIILLVLGLLLFAISLYRAARHPRASLGAMGKPAVVLVAAALLLGIVQLRHATFYGWDEIGNWGSYAKEVIVGKALIGADGLSYNKYWPPGLALLYYFFAGSLGYSEHIIYVAHFVSMVACLAVLLHRASWKSPVAWIVALGASYFVVQGVEGGFVNLYQDTALSMFFAASIAAYFILHPYRLEHLLIPGLFALPLIKPVGVFFGLSVVALIALDQVVLGLEAPASSAAGGPALSTRVKSALGGFRHVPARRMLVYGLLLTAPLIAHESWNLRVRILGIPQERPVTASITQHYGATALTLQDVWKVFFTGAYERSLDAATHTREKEEIDKIRAVRHRFLAALFYKPVNYPNPDRLFSALNGFPLIAWYGIGAGLFLCAAGFGKGLGKARCVGLLCGLSALLPVYIFINIIVYALMLVPFSALILDSYDRLMGIFMGAFLLVAMAVLIVDFEDETSRHLRPGSSEWIALVAVAALYVLQPPATDILLHPKPKLVLRKSMEPMLAFVDEHVPVGSKTYIVAQNTTGFAYWILRYELIPRSTNYWDWTLGKRRCPNDVWHDDKTAAEWAGRLRNEKFDFVLVAQSDDEFWERYRGLFQSGSADGHAVFLYKVEPGTGPGVLLVPVAEAQQRLVPKMTPDYIELPDSGSYAISAGVCAYH